MYLKRVRIVGSLVCLVCFVYAACICGEGKEADSNDDGTYEEIDSMLKQDAADLHIPAMSVIIVDRDQVLFTGNYGSCESEDTPFIIGSVSKSFTALCIMQLAEEGKIDLNKPIKEYLDVSRYLKNAEDGTNITVKQLLNQTSGLGVYQVLGNAEITSAVGVHQYANVNYGLLGKIIEAVSGESYEEYVTTHVFIPLRMEHSAASLEKGKECGLISGYRNYFGFPVPGEPDYPKDDSWGTVPAGYLIASARDMGKYLQMYLNGGDGIISSDSIHQMFYDNVYVEGDEPSYYGMGWALKEQYGVPVLFHSGLVENYMSNMLLLPNDQVGIIFLVNTNDYLVTDNMMSQIRDNVIRKLLNEEVKPLDRTVYMKDHLILDAGYLLLVLLAVLPLIKLRKWKRKSICSMVCNGVLHFLVPTLLLTLPAMTGNPLWTIWLFVKDLYFVLILSAFLLYTGGFMKIILLVKQNRQPLIRG